MAALISVELLRRLGGLRNTIDPVSRRYERAGRQRNENLDIEHFRSDRTEKKSLQVMRRAIGRSAAAAKL